MQQSRTKWQRSRRNIAIGDVVILNDEGLRGQFNLARVIDTIPEADNLTRRVKLMMATSDLGKDGKRQGKPIVLERPIHKLTLLVESV